MGDIVDRLRSTCKADKDCSHAPCFGYCLPLEAADEIQLLRSALFTAAGELSTSAGCSDLHPEYIYRSLLEEARHE